MSFKVKNLVNEVDSISDCKPFSKGSTLLIILFLLFNLPALAESNDKRIQELFKSIRCMTCQGQSINDSEAHLAQVMRQHIRDEIKLGKSDDEILTYIADRYGSEVILKTNFNSETIWLWCVPFLLFSYLALQLRKSFRAPDNNI